MARAKTQTERNRDWIAEHGIRAVSLTTNHGIGIHEAKRLLAEMPIGCEICGNTERKLHYDHCHETGVHRGWLCNRCNTALPMIENPELLENALRYLNG